MCSFPGNLLSRALPSAALLHVTPYLPFFGFATAAAGAAFRLPVAAAAAAGALAAAGTFAAAPFAAATVGAT